MIYQHNNIIKKNLSNKIIFKQLVTWSFPEFVEFLPKENIF